MAEFDPNIPNSLGQVSDFLIYRFFVAKGRAAPSDPYSAMMEALHDNSMLQGMFHFLASHPLTAAITGGHGEPRGSNTYKAVLQISKRLTEEGFLMVSGGGPGVMEATHLGASLMFKDQSTVDRALELLSAEPDLPDVANIIDSEGVVDPELLAKLHKWLVPAFQVRKDIKDPGASLAVPTWYYGHEPPTPLATHIAKYFQNSIREDVLLAVAANGVVYAPGRAGTLQEIFQDAAQNYYHSQGGVFSPMVFYDSKFWHETLRVKPLLKDLFVKNGRGDEYKAKVRYLDGVDEVVDFLVGQEPSAEKSSIRFKTLGLAPMMERALH
jgi:predicted Rossmann-fold nucleotide-binding protein